MLEVTKAEENNPKLQKEYEDQKKEIKLLKNQIDSKERHKKRLNEAFTQFESEIIELKKKLEYAESSKENNVCDKSDSKYRSDELRKENRKLNAQIEELQDTENDLRKKKMEYM